MVRGTYRARLSGYRSTYRARSSRRRFRSNLGTAYRWHRLPVARALYRSPVGSVLRDSPIVRGLRRLRRVAASQRRVRQRT